LFERQGHGAWRVPERKSRGPINSIDHANSSSDRGTLELPNRPITWPAPQPQPPSGCTFLRFDRHAIKQIDPRRGMRGEDCELPGALLIHDHARARYKTEPS